MLFRVFMQMIFLYAFVWSTCLNFFTGCVRSPISARVPIDERDDSPSLSLGFTHTKDAPSSPRPFSFSRSAPFTDDDDDDDDAFSTHR